MPQVRTLSSKRLGGAWAERVVWLSGVGVILWGVLSAGLFWAMKQTPERFGAIMARTPMPVIMLLPFETLWKQARAGALQLGSAAPDFELPLLDKSARVRLSSLRGRPVVLVFGSYT